jgi:hypothetical protein
MTAAKKESQTPIQDSRERVKKDFTNAMLRHEKRLNNLGHTCDRYEESAILWDLLSDHALRLIWSGLDKQGLFDAVDDLNRFLADAHAEASRKVSKKK